MENYCYPFQIVFRGSGWCCVLCVVFNYFLQVVGIGRLKILNDGGGVGIG